MAEVGFYIDTGAREEEVEEEEVDGSEDEDKVLGSKDAAVEKRQRERAAKERNLSSFLFGKLSDNVKEIVDSEADSDLNCKFINCQSDDKLLFSIALKFQ